MDCELYRGSESREVKDRLEDPSEDLILAAPIRSILVLAVIAVLVTTLEAFAEIVVIFVETDVVRIVPVACVLITVGTLVVKIPTILTVRLARIIAFLVTAAYGILKHLSSIRTRVEIIPASVVTIVVDQIVVVPSLLQPKLIRTNSIPVALLVTQVCPSTLALEFTLALELKLLPVSPSAVVLRPTLLLKLLLLRPIVGLVCSLPAIV